MKGQARSKQRRDARYEAAVRRQIVFNRALASQYRPYAPVEQFLRPGDTADKYAPPATVYFMHDRLTPGTVRGRWDDVTEIPNVGDVLDLEMGYYGARVQWTVARVEWLNSYAVMLHMTGPTGEVAA